MLGINLATIETMAVRKIIRLGHPTLRKVARPLTPKEMKSKEIHRLVDDMVDTLHDYGGIGLAAPQVNESIRLAIVEVEGGETRYGHLDSIPLTVCVNPVIEVLDGPTAGFWEGCLSVPGMRGFVERPQHIRLTYTDLSRKQHEIEVSGFFATVFQHEFDHLDGRLYVDHIEDKTKFMFEDEYMKYVQSAE